MDRPDLFPDFVHHVVFGPCLIAVSWLGRVKHDARNIREM